MNTPASSGTDNPITADRAAPFIGDLTVSGQEMITNMSKTVNDVQFMRAMQIGYMMACQDYGMPMPDFGDPAQDAGLV